MTMGYLAGRTIGGQPAAYEAALVGAEAAR
jgi:hypothetical protein